MSVVEYKVKFTQLSLYASMMVATERERCRCFEEGYHMRYEKGFHRKSYGELCVASMRAKRLQKERHAYFQTQKQKRNT